MSRFWCSGYSTSKRVLDVLRSSKKLQLSLTGSPLSTSNEPKINIIRSSKPPKAWQKGIKNIKRPVFVKKIEQKSAIASKQYELVCSSVGIAKIYQSNHVASGEHFKALISYSLRLQTRLNNWFREQTGAHSTTDTDFSHKTVDTSCDRQTVTVLVDVVNPETALLLIAHMKGLTAHLHVGLLTIHDTPAE